MAASQSILEILIQAVDQSASGLASAQDNLKKTSQAALEAGAELAGAGAAITAAYGVVVGAAASVQESQDNLKQGVTDAVKGANSETNSYATTVKFLEDKINSYKASIASATATLDTNTGSTVKVAAAHEAAAAKIATAQVNIAKYQAQLDILQNTENLRGASVDDITAKLETQAVANVSLGYSIADSTHSLSQAFTATKSVSDALQVNQAAMDLARAKNIDLTTATNQVILAMNGQGRALASYGIQIKDGLSGMEALNAVQAAVGGQAQAFAGTLSGQLAVAMQTFNELLADMGTTQLPMLGQLLGFIVKIVQAVDDWTQKHQKLTEYILIFVGVLGVTLTVLGTLLIIAGTVGLAITAGLSAAFVGIAAAVAVGVAAIIAIGVAIVQNWNYIRENFIAAWQIISTNFTAVWTVMKDTAQNTVTSIANLIGSAISGIQSVWNSVWTAISNFFTNIWDGIKNSFQSSISFIQSAVQNFVSWASGILGPILGPINAIGNAASGFGKSVGGAVGSALSVIGIHDAIITPQGQIIQSDPADYLIATKSPGNLGGGVTVNLNGGMYLSENAARLIADQVAKLVNRQIKVRNYAI